MIGALHVLVAVPVATGLALGLIVFLIRSGARQNRLLGLVLFSMALLIAAGPGVTLWIGSAPHVYAGLVVYYILSTLLLWAYPALLGTLMTPLSRPFRSRAWTWVGLPMALALATAILFAPHRWSSRPVYVGTGGFEWSPRSGPMGELFGLLWFAVFVYGIVVAWSAHRRASPHRRTQTRAWLVAFAGHDAIWAAYLFFFNAGLAAAFSTPAVWVVAASVATLWLTAGLTYGVLHSQLFDLDLKIKWTLSRGAAASVFVAVFFVVGIGTSEFLLDRFGYVYGAAAAGLLLLALRPLQRFGERVADAAMPRVEDSHEYRRVRKRQVYAAALESALEEGDISPKERGMLATLQDQLGLAARDAHDLERQARAASPALTPAVE